MKEIKERQRAHIEELEIMVRERTKCKCKIYIYKEEGRNIIDISFYPVKRFSFIKRYRIRKLCNELVMEHIPYGMILKACLRPFEFFRSQ